MSEEIQLFPSCYSTGIHKSNKKLQKGMKNEIQYYIGLKKYYESILNPTEEELEKFYNDAKAKSNKITDVFKCQISDLNANIIKDFRFKQPFINYDEQEILIDPYILGAWLGDGTSLNVTLTNVDIPIIKAWKNYANSLDLNVSIVDKKERKSIIKENETEFVASYRIIAKVKKSRHKTILQKHFETYDLFQNKHIPKQYLENSEEIRSQVLAGIIDTDGSLSRNTYDIVQKSKQLTDDIVTLAKSLGYYTKYNECTKSCTVNGEKFSGQYYRITIEINQLSPPIPVLLERKIFIPTENQSWHNPTIDLEGNIIEKNKNTWTLELQKLLYNLIEHFKKIEPNQAIPWKRVAVFDQRLKNFAPDSLRAIYTKTLVKSPETYQDPELTFDFNPIESEWMENYNSILPILKEGRSPSSSSTKGIWLNNQKALAKKGKMYKSKQKLLNDLENINTSK